jgi:hypothetical protein
MQKYLLAGVRIVGIILVAHALMLIGADEISTLEAGGIRMVRSLGTILTLYGADPMSLQENLPGFLASIVSTVLSWPGWGVLAVAGGVLAGLARPRD